jgi:AsmA protein
MIRRLFPNANPNNPRNPANSPRKTNGHRLFRRLLQVVGGLVAVIAVVVGVGAVVISQMDWNQYKPQLTALASEKLGRPLTIEGDLRLRFWPILGISVEKISLANAKGGVAPQLLTIERVTAEADLAMLLRRQINVTSLRIDQPKIYLEQLPDGQGNWNLPLFAAAKPAAAKPADKSAAKTEGGAPKEGVEAKGAEQAGKEAPSSLENSQFDISKVVVHDAAITYQAAGQKLAVDGMDVEVQSHSIAGMASVTEGVDRGTTVALTAAALNVQLDGVSAEPIQLTKLKAQADLSDGRVLLNPLQADFLGGQLTGKADVSLGGSNPSDMVLQLQGVTVDKLAQLFKKPAQPAAAVSGGEIQATLQLSLPSYGLQDADWADRMAAMLKLNIDQLQLPNKPQKLPLTNVKVDLEYRNQTLKAKQLVAEALGGTIDLSGSSHRPQTSPHDSVIKLKINDLLLDQIKSAFAPDMPLAGGKVSLTVDGRARGQSVEAVETSLTAKAGVDIRDTSYQGYDGAKLIAGMNSIKSPADVLPLLSGNGLKGGQTKIAKVSGDFDIANGVARTANSFADAPDVGQAKAVGRIAFIAETVDMTATVTLAKPIDLPSFEVMARGPLASPALSFKADRVLAFYAQKSGREALKALSKDPQGALKDLGTKLMDGSSEKTDALKKLFH